MELLANVAARPSLRVSAGAPTADYNAQLVSTTRPSEDGTYVVAGTNVRFGAGHLGGGDRTRITRMQGYAKVHVAQIEHSAAERAAAQAVHDAVRAILHLAVPTDWRGEPAFGMSRLYLDRRSSMVEFPNDAPPAALQGVLQAMSAYGALGPRS